VKPAWTQYWDSISSEDTSVDQIISEFPFRDYFSNAPQPLFPPAADREQILDIAQGCYRHVEKIFTELEDIRPFEILRNPRDKANYLLVKEARIIAMTSTHAAMRRQEIASLGFHYDNVIMEEAAQITEIENFIPLALQNPQNGELPLQRIVLCGDHLQNSPVIQNLAFRQYANLEQSLFQRLVRLGVPTIMLDQQGRARPSIAELYKWRYPSLSNLPSVLSNPEFQIANAGFKHEYQFIDVQDYKGKGEDQPTPHWMINLGEAEYAVALFMYMRLLGYPASKITILTTYAGQKSLINDVLGHKCKNNPLFGRPKHVATVDKYQGEQNDCKSPPLLPFFLQPKDSNNTRPRHHPLPRPHPLNRLPPQHPPPHRRPIARPPGLIHSRPPLRLRVRLRAQTSFRCPLPAPRQARARHR
jgi:intron-binding protein aquarius